MNNGEKKMNLKYLTLFLALAILLFGMGSISAIDNTNDTVAIEENANDEIVKINHDEIKSIEEEKSANTTTQTTTSNSVKTPKKTTVSTPYTKFIFKRSSKFKITIKDKETNKTIKNLKILFKIKDGKKYKTYTLKTNSKGIATFSTKKLSKGYHKFTITSKNDNYKVSKKDSIFIGNLYYTTINMGKSQKLKNGDVLRTFMQKKDMQYKKGVYTDLWYSGGKNPSKASVEAKYTQIYSAKFFFKNKKTGEIKIVSSKGTLSKYKGELYLDLPHTDLMKGFTPIKTRIGYLTSK